MPSSPPLHDPEFWSGDPYPAFAELRATDPVHRYEGVAGSFWVITRHADVLAISKDPATFCSGNGVLLTDLNRPTLSPESIITLDPPEHPKHRKLVSPSLSVRRVAELEGRVRAIVTEVLDRIDPTEAVDAVEAISMPVPLLVIAELLGVPRADLADFRRWSDAMIAVASDHTDAAAMADAAGLFGYISEVVRARRAEPADDLVSTVVQSSVDGEVLSDADATMFVLALLVAGNETTRSLISNSLDVLADRPAQRRLMVEDQAVIPTAVEELLRWEAPVMSFCRTATRDTELSGTAIAEGEQVILCYQSANRDEAVYGPTADRLDVTRDPNPHTSFGYAAHYCLGAGLARLEGRVVFEELLARWPDYEAAGPMERLPSRLARGVAHLPLVLQP